MAQSISNKFRGNGRVVVKSITNMNFMGRKLEKGDVLLTFNDVSISLVYQDSVKRAADSGTLLAAAEYYPYMLQVENIPNSLTLRELMYIANKNVKTQFTQVKRVSIQSIEEDSTIYLAASDEISLLKVKVFDNTGAAIAVAVNTEDKSITILDEPTDWVELHITLEGNGDQMTLEMPDLPYLVVEAQVEGRIGKKEVLFVLEVPKATILNAPEYDFNAEYIFGGFLLFGIVDGHRHSPVTLGTVEL